MRSTLFILFISILFGGCGSVKTSSDNASETPLYSQGIQPFSSSPFSDSLSLGVAKLYKGNNASGSGIFVSEDGLFLTNYSAILDFISSGDNTDIFQTGFVATSKTDEVRLQGISLLVEIEQIDVTDEIQKNVTELSPNNEIYRSIQEEKTRLLNERRGNQTDLFVEIKDLYSVNRQVMFVYRIIRNVRLVFAPSVKLNSLKSDELESKLENEYVVLRAYNGENSSAPYQPGFHFKLEKSPFTADDELISFGFPGKTYRLETSRAIEFYHTKLNPYIVSFFDIYLNKEDSLAKLDDLYALRSASNRYSVSQNLSFFQTAQEMISGRNVISIKKTNEDKLLKEIKADSTLPPIYSDLFSRIDQAYDIAAQTADILYSTNYFNTLSSLDNLATLYRNYADQASASGSTEQLMSQTIASHSQMLQQINSGAELDMLKEFIPVFKSIPQDQQPLMLFDLFTEASPDDVKSFSAIYVEERLASSFLFDAERALQALNNNAIFDDPLFNLLEEIAFSFETAQQNFLRHYAYLFPAQQILTRVKMNSGSSKLLSPDSDLFLSYNIGSLHPRTDSNSEYFYTTNDFSGKAPGTAIINSDGSLLGIVGEELGESILGNYIYLKETSYLKAIRTSAILDEIKNTEGTTDLVLELTSEN
ncbi:MAG: S46 family peptidase [Balneola sp.]